MTITLNVLGLSENILYIVKRDAYFRWSFGPISAWGSIESTTILTKRYSLWVCNKGSTVESRIGVFIFKTIVVTVSGFWMDQSDLVIVGFVRLLRFKLLASPK